MNAQLLLCYGDRTCDECNGTGEGIGGEPCDWCDGGQINERHNLRRIDWTAHNETARELIAFDRFRSAAKRRGCWQRGVMSCRFIIGGTWDRSLGRMLWAITSYPTLLPTGPTIALGAEPVGAEPVGITATLDYFNFALGNARIQAGGSL